MWPEIFFNNLRKTKFKKIVSWKIYCPSKILETTYLWDANFLEIAWVYLFWNCAFDDYILKISLNAWVS